MTDGFLRIAMTPAVKAAQTRNGSAGLYGDAQDAPVAAADRFTAAERDFIGSRDSFYIATVSERGWPYMQHRGGPPGFLRVLDDRTVACADFRGNRQYLSVGNLSVDDRACLFFMDYPHRRRLKVFVHVETRETGQGLELPPEIAVPGYRAKVERALIFHLDAYDWNCPRHITPRFTEGELVELLAPYRTHIERLETELATLKVRLAHTPQGAQQDP